jgi:hypothetical protein
VIRKGFAYSVSALVIFSRADVDGLMELSATHYDGKCKAAGKIGGFLYGIHNAVCVLPDASEEFPRCLTWDNVDTLCKILEQSRTSEQRDLYGAMRALLSEMSDEQRRLN